MGTLLLLWATRASMAAEPVLASASVEIGAGLRISQSAMDDPHDVAVQRHPTVTWGLSSEIGGKWVRGRLRLDRVTYLETVSSTTIEMKANLLAALDLVVRL